MTADGQEVQQNETLNVCTTPVLRHHKCDTVHAIRYIAIDPHDLDRQGGRALDEGGWGTACRLGGPPLAPSVIRTMQFYKSGTYITLSTPAASGNNNIHVARLNYLEANKRNE